MRDVDVAVIGAGAAGLGAARRLEAAGVSALVLEARPRTGGRAWTAELAPGLPVDLGCGWLHSADENECCALAEELRFTLNRTPPPWGTQWRGLAFAPHEQREYRAASERFYARLARAADEQPDQAAAAFLEPGCRWNALLDAVATYINGVELAAVSVEDFGRYHDTGVNWRVREGYGALIAAFGEGCEIATGCPVTLIDHSGPVLRLATPRGEVRARAAIVTVPPTILAAEALRFAPALSDKLEAAHALPLGVADKLFLRIDDAEDIPADAHLFGSTARTETGTYHLRPFGRPVVEAFFAGSLARELERGGPDAFTAFTLEELAGLLGNGIRARLTPLGSSAWGRDPWSRGSYSYAVVGRAEARAALAAPVAGRLLFAGEACSRHDFSTAHGAYRTGVAAAEAALSAVRTRRDGLLR